MLNSAGRKAETPSRQFQVNYYLEKAPDVAKTGIDPLRHYLESGLKEGREINPFEKRIAARSAQSRTKKIQRKSKSWRWDEENKLRKILGSLSEKNGGIFERIPVSIVMPTYNRQNSISRAIRSVQRQTFSNWELHIVDDGSTDATEEILKQFLADKRITYTKIAHTGVAAARNVALDMASGDIIFYLDSDNCWRHDFLSLMVSFISASGIDAAYCGTELLDGDGKIKGYRGDHFDWLGCLRQNYIDMNCFAHVRKAAEGNRFDQSIRRLVDWDFIYALLKKARQPSSHFVASTITMAKRASA